MRNLNFNRILSYVLVSLNLIQIQSCYTTSIGDFIKSDRVNGSEKVISTDVKVNSLPKPTLENPVLILGFEQKQTNEVTYIKKYKEKKEPTILSWIAVIGGLVGFIASVTTEDKNISSIGMPIFAIGGVTAALTSRGNTDNILEGEKEYIKEEGSFGPIAGNYLVDITYQNNSKELQLNNNSEIRIDLINDLMINRTMDENFNISVEIAQLRFKDNLYIKSSDFLYKYVKVSKQKVEVIDEMNGAIRSLGFINIGSEFRLLHQGEELWKIDYKSKEGFIQPNSGEIFWAR